MERTTCRRDGQRTCDSGGNGPPWSAHSAATVEVGTETVAVTARVAEGDERERIWAKQKADYPGFADYESKTSRQIPVVILST